MQVKIQLCRVECLAEGGRRGVKIPSHADALTALPGIQKSGFHVETSIYTPAHVRPPPKPTRIIFWPGCNRPFIAHFIQRKGDAGRAGIGVTVEVAVKLFGRHAQTADACVQNAHVCLMADNPIDVVGGDSGFLDERVHALGNGRHSEAEDGLSVHRHVLRAQRAADADQRVAAHADDVFIRRVRAKLEDGRARAVAEEHTGVSIGQYPERNSSVPRR